MSKDEFALFLQAISKDSGAELSQKQAEEIAQRVERERWEFCTKMARKKNFCQYLMLWRD